MRLMTMSPGPKRVSLCQSCDYSLFTIFALAICAVQTECQRPFFRGALSKSRGWVVDCCLVSGNTYRRVFGTLTCEKGCQ